MNKFILGLITGIVIMLALNFLGFGDFIKGFFNNTASNIVAPEDLVSGAQEFGSLKVIITTNKTQLVSGIEVDVADHPGTKMTVGVTDNNGTVVFEKMPVGNFVIFFNDVTYPKSFERVSALIPVQIIKGQVTEKNIELSPKQ